jgi:hypothetical protein
MKNTACQKIDKVFSFLRYPLSIDILVAITGEEQGVALDTINKMVRCGLLSMDERGKVFRAIKKAV